MLEWSHSATWKPSYLRGMSGESLPRAHHYHFARSALPCVFYSEPDRVVEALAGSAPQRFLADLWSDVGDKVVGDKLGADLPAVGLRVEPVALKSCQGAVIHMPVAERPGECVFVLLVTPPAAKPPMPPSSSIRARLAGALAGALGPASRPAVKGIWEQLRSKGAPVARCFALELVPNKQTGELAPRIAEFSTVMGCVQTGLGSALESGEFVRKVVECLDVA